MNSSARKALLILIGITIAGFGSGPAVSLARAQAGPAAGSNEMQRALAIDQYRIAGPSGAARGEVIYYYKCWFCHNDYTRAAGTSAPTLKDIFNRPRLVSGQPVNEETVSQQIRNGSNGMPGFRHSLTDTDIADLVSYLRDRCCYEETGAPPNPWYKASASNTTGAPQGKSNLRGGPRGLVRLAGGAPLEGVMVQLVGPNGVRTTVYSNQDGEYEFPVMPAASYMLRLPRPVDILPYERQGVSVNGAARLADIVVEKRSENDYVPPTPEVFSLLTDAEMLWNFSGTGMEKQAFSRACGNGCHSYHQIFRNRFDEHGWRLIVDRMQNHSGSPLINRRPARGNPEREELLVKWLSRVRGSDSQDAPMRVFPRPHGAATRAVITEYELPRVLLAPHDVSGDSKGNIWYSSHRTPYMGKLDPATGIVTEYEVPPTPAGILPGTHRIQVDQHDIVWASENWAHSLVRLDPATGRFSKVAIPSEAPINSPMGGNLTLAPDGFVWKAQQRAVLKLDPQTGQIVQRIPFTIDLVSPYDNIISDDGNFWGGGSAAGGGDSMELLDIRTGKLTEVKSFSKDSTAARGGFDPENNPWFGGRGGMLLQLDVKKNVIREFWPPTPHVTFYEAMPDKNGEVWAGELHGGRFVRYNPKSDRWVEYVLPEPFSHNRRTWIDNSTNPVTVWYVDNNNYLVRIQPRE